MYRLTIISFVILLSACSATGPKYTEMAVSTPTVAPNQSRIYFYRKDAFMLGGRSAPITINGKLAGEVANAGFFYVDLTPGNHVITTELWDAPGKYTLYFNVEPGKTHYVQIAPREDAVTAGVLFGVIGMALESGNKDKGGAFALHPMTPQQASTDLVKLAYSGTAETASVKRDFGTANITQPATSAQAPAPILKMPTTRGPDTEDNANHASAITPASTIVAGALGYLSDHQNDRQPEHIYSTMITRLMADTLKTGGHDRVETIDWQQARDIEYENNDYPRSIAVCEASGADYLYINVLENTITGGNAAWFPESTFYLYNCHKAEKLHKTYTLNLHIEDGPGFKYEYTLKKTFREFVDSYGHRATGDIENTVNLSRSNGRF